MKIPPARAAHRQQLVVADAPVAIRLALHAHEAGCAVIDGVPRLEAAARVLARRRLGARDEAVRVHVLLLARSQFPRLAEIAAAHVVVRGRETEAYVRHFVDLRAL